MSSAATPSVVPSFDTAAIAHEQCTEIEQSSLSQLLHDKQFLTLSELESLRKAIESHQQIQMTIKNNNPLKVHIQCRHFKSKKCSFQITYKAIVAGDESGEVGSISLFQASSAAAVASSSIPINSSSSIFSGISLDSSVAVAQYSSNKEGAASLNDIKRASSTGRREETFIAAASVDSHSVAVASAALSEPSAILQTVSVKLDASCSPTVVGLVENCKTTPSETQSLHNPQQPGKQLSMSSWQQSNPPVTMLLQNFDASATMWEGEKREGRSIKNNSTTTINQSQANQTLQNQQQNQTQSEKMALEVEAKQLHHDSDDDDDDDESFQNMIDEDQCEHLRSPTISPFVFNDASSGAQEIPYLCLDDPKEEDKTNQTGAPTSEIQKQMESGTLLFKLSTCKLQHRNHPVMSDEQYTIHLAKRWLEGHQEKIERIYSELREKKGASFKITPKIIKKQLQDSFDIDIYAKCTDKEHKRFLKKKLDNLMKAIRQKERTSGKKNLVIKTEVSAAPEKSTVTKSKRKAPAKSSTSDRMTTSKSTMAATVIAPVAVPAPAVTKIDVEDSIKQEDVIVIKPDPVQSSEIDIEDSHKDMHKDSMSSSIQEEESTTQPIFTSNLCTPKIEAAPQPKIYKEEWESFLEFDLPQQRMQQAH